METFDYYIVPLLNVDGYAYSHSTDRLWRKNRSPNHFPRCIGTDLNRNYPNHWNEEGASGNECDVCYRGDHESSEAEIQGIVNFLMELKVSGTEFLSLIDFHSYSQMLLYPWAYSANVGYPPDYTDHSEAAAVGVSAIKSVYGTIYTHGPVAKLLYSASGNSIDWGYANLGAKYSYAVELRDTGEYGFLLPEDQIEPTGVETFELVRSLGKTYLREMEMDNLL
ncbi:Mast cell carboxypeptidase A [Holothuria leucospilota]|uniref:Mast cell carboxypeptidase A n=1 Tax=Holothuria leucospilota TaxID=206669 RepID=A0A9Q1CFM8_HOLLE|nr:Mast cell carboxypeptidase A [Holothuria leucospilota]